MDARRADPLSRRAGDQRRRAPERQPARDVRDPRRQFADARRRLDLRRQRPADVHAGANYCSQFFLDAAADDLIASDIDLAKQANMDMLRLNAHVEPPALYDSADRSGILLWQDLPLIGSYVHRADARSLAFFRDAVLTQAEELMHLGYNHPSIVTYAVHADPPWSQSLKWLGERPTEQLNR